MSGLRSWNCGLFWFCNSGHGAVPLMIRYSSLRNKCVLNWNCTCWVYNINHCIPCNIWTTQPTALWIQILHGMQWFILTDPTVAGLSALLLPPHKATKVSHLNCTQWNTRYPIEITIHLKKIFYHHFNIHIIMLIFSIISSSISITRRGFLLIIDVLFLS